MESASLGNGSSSCLPRRSELVLLGLILTLAYGFRIQQPETIITGGGDIPNHLMASLRLHDTSFFPLRIHRENFFFQLIAFYHGYTTVLVPYLFYEAAFAGLNLPLTESNLVYVNSLLGVLSLVGVYWFFRLHFGVREALWMLALLAVVPIHVGFSAVIPGFQVLYIGIFYICLGCLCKFLRTRRRRWLYLYALGVMLYIGGDTAFPVGLWLQALYLYVMQPGRPFRERLRIIKEVYSSRPVLLCILIPITLHLGYFVASSCVDYFHFGVFHRLFSGAKVVPAGDYNPLKFLANVLRQIGPAAIVALAGIPLAIRSPASPAGRFLLLPLIVYSVLLGLSGRGDWTAHVIILAVPLVALTVLAAPRRTALLALPIIALTAVYAAAVLYGVNLGFKTPRIYGSRLPDQGLKTLAYLIRKDMIPVTRREVSGGSGRGLALAIRFEGSYFFLGINIKSVINMKQLVARTPPSTEPLLLVYRPQINSAYNDSILRAAHEKNFRLLGRIQREGQTVMELYSNAAAPEYRTYAVREYNPRFDREFATMERLAKYWLGYWGGR